MTQNIRLETANVPDDITTSVLVAESIYRTLGSASIWISFGAGGGFHLDEDNALALGEWLIKNAAMPETNEQRLTRENSQLRVELEKCRSAPTYPAWEPRPLAKEYHIGDRVTMDGQDYEAIHACYTIPSTRENWYGHRATCWQLIPGQPTS